MNFVDKLFSISHSLHVKFLFFDRPETVSQNKIGYKGIYKNEPIIVYDGWEYTFSGAQYYIYIVVPNKENAINTWFYGAPGKSLREQLIDMGWVPVKKQALQHFI